MSDNDYDYEFSDSRDNDSYSSDNSVGSRAHESDYEFEEAGTLRNDEDYRHHHPGEQDEDGSSSQGTKPTLQMCSKHKPGAMIEICKVCSAALAMVRPDIAKQLLAPTQAAVPPSALSRYSGRSDEKAPTLIFSDSTLELAYNTFTQGRFRGKTHFPELVKKFLTLPPDQHEKLILDLKLEPFFKKLEGERRFKHIFSLRRDMGDCLKMLRVSQRPIFHIISVLDSLLATMKESGQCAGIKFLEDPPCRQNNKVPKPLINTLAIDTADNVLPLPDVPSLLNDLHDLSSRDEAALKNTERQILSIFNGYRDHVVQQFTDLFSCMSGSVNEVDDFLAFYCDLYGHVDACTRDLLRSKLANCFKLEYRGEVLGRNLTHEEKSSIKSTGLLGGEERVRAALSEATKKDDLLKKSIVPRKPQISDKKQKNSYGGSSSSRNNNRAKSPDSRRFKGGSSRAADKSARNSRASDRSGNKDNAEEAVSSPKRKRPRKRVSDKKGEYISPTDFSNPPQSFTECWPHFFTSAAIMMITAVGLVVDHIPWLHSLPLGGRLSHCIESWRKVCKNSWVCSVIEFGYKIPLKFKPHQKKIPTNPQVTESAFTVLVNEAKELKSKQAVIVASHCKGEYISSYFAVPKPRSPGKFRPILNLKHFNKCVKKYKFTMEHLKSVRDWIRPGSWCIGLDLKDAFPHIPIHRDSRKYLRFQWLGELLEWIALPFGLTCSPRVITKVIKPVIAFLRSTWHILITIFIDDMLVQAQSPQLVLFHAQLVMLTFMCLGWSFRFEKCNLVPSQKITHLGFEIDTVAMHITCPKDKVVRLQEKCRIALVNEHISVHNLERLLGTMESVKPSTPLAAMHYRSLQRQLICSKIGRRKPSKIVQLSSKSLLELRWWVSKTGFFGNCTSSISEKSPTIHIWTDANLSMGGARSSRGTFFQRAWTKDELDADYHINLLEIRAARDGISALAQPGDCVRLHMDNRTACAYVRKQGGTKSSLLSQEACLLWDQSVSKNIEILTPHWLSTKDNVEADFLSRHSISQWDIQLDPDIFTYILGYFQVQPTLDAFASREIHQLERYMTWYPDSNAVAQDALLHPWDRVTYLFPPVPLLLKVLKLVREQRISAILVCPHWPTALWWSLVVDMLVVPPLPLPHYKQALIGMGEGQVLPYLDPLVAVYISAEILVPATLH